jgi:NADPH-dependent curcumin reductase CurA
MDPLPPRLRARPASFWRTVVAMARPINRMWKLAARPQGDIKDTDLTWHEEPAREPADGEVLVEVRWLSLDPTNRVWMNEAASYLPPIPLGDVMRGTGLGRVVESRHPGYPVGATVSGMLGWQTHAVVKADGLFLHPPGLPFTDEDYLGVINHIGATAYFGIKDVAPVRPGDTFVVSAAAGAVGSLAGQIAKIEGARVIGIASTPEKCAWLKELGFDEVIDRKVEDIAPALDRTCPKGIDVYFDNVGGPILDACLARLRVGARIALCGMISGYNAQKPPPGPAHFGNILVKRATLKGFIIIDYAPRFSEAFQALGGWMKSGQLRYKLDVVEDAVAGLRRLFTGENMGKLAVRVAR